MKRVLLLILGATAVTELTPALHAAEPAVGDANAETTTGELKSEHDPTILLRRVWSETEWNQYKSGRNDIEETLGGVWAWRVSYHQDWGVRLKVPYKWHLAGDDPGDSDESGLGDIKLASGTAFRLNESWRVGGGVEMRFPTAADDVLGDNVWQPQLSGAVAWDVTQQFSLSPSFEYNKSIAEEDGASDKHFLEMFFPATYVLPHGWSVTARYEAKVDFENDNYWTHSAKLSIGKHLKQQPLSLSLSIKKSFDGGDKEFQVNFGVTYYFRSRPETLQAP